MKTKIKKITLFVVICLPILFCGCVGKNTVIVTDAIVEVLEAPVGMRAYRYTGPITDTVNALPNGKGMAYFHAIYYEHDSTGKENRRKPISATYNGYFVDGLLEDTTGTATLEYANKQRYVGTFEHGSFQKGKMTYPDGSSFDGEWKDGVYFNGTLIDTSGSVFTGQFDSEGCVLDGVFVDASKRCHKVKEGKRIN